MIKMIYVVEELGTVDGDNYEVKANYCFDTEHEARTFIDIMRRNNKPEHYIIHIKKA